MTPFNIFNSAVVELTPDNLFNSAPVVATVVPPIINRLAAGSDSVLLVARIRLPFNVTLPVED